MTLEMNTERLTDSLRRAITEAQGDYRTPMVLPRILGVLGAYGLVDAATANLALIANDHRCSPLCAEHGDVRDTSYVAVPS